MMMLSGCTAAPFGSYLKALGMLRLVSEQADAAARGWWDGDVFCLQSRFDASALADFFLISYRPTPILAPWNGGSGFYEKDRKVGINAIACSTSERFADYRASIAIVRGMAAVQGGKADKNSEDERRLQILLDCRNLFPDGAVEWLDAAVGIAADGARSFAPVLGTGGNEGRLDYTNNFMERIAGLLIEPDKKAAPAELLRHALFGERTEAMQDGAAGQFDPGRAGGANQGQGVSGGCVTNPWDFVLTLEGAVAWASGMYRRQGMSFRSILCSPFTVRASRVGFGSAAENDDARAEVWTPLWKRPALYAELRVVLREGRASIDGKPALTGMQFAEAAAALGTDRGIDRFVRYSLLKRRGDSYVALPAGIFTTGYRSSSDRVREIETVLDRLRIPDACAGLRRGVESAMFEALKRGLAGDLRGVAATLGRLLRRMVTVHVAELPYLSNVSANEWVRACGAGDTPEVRIAAALASIYQREAGPIRHNLSAASAAFAWFGRDLPARLISVLDRRLQRATAAEADGNPLGAACALHPGDATLFIEKAVDDELIESLLFAFAGMNWQNFEGVRGERAEPLPLYVLLKLLFLAEEIEVEAEGKRVRADARIISLLRANDAAEAARLARYRLRVAGLRPIETPYYGGVDPDRLAAALLIPVRMTKFVRRAVLHEEESSENHA